MTSARTRSRAGSVLLIGAAALSLCAIVTVSVGPTTARAARQRTIVKEGHIEPGAPDWVYVPFEVPRGVSRMHVEYDYNRTGNALDIGIFDEDGTGLGNEAGFRGWSGGFRTEFAISRSGATPGYVPGAIRPGTWNVILGPYTVAPGGIDYRITITLSFDDPGHDFEPDPADTSVSDAPGWYRGDLHIHTVHSDGRNTPDDVISGARAAGLDFFVSTEHNTDTAHAVWGEHVPPDLLAVNGEEVTTRGGHYNAIGLGAGNWIDWRYRPEDDQIRRFIDEIHADSAVAVVNHPFAACKACDWSFPYEGMDGIEVWNGPWEPTDEAAVAKWDSLLREGRFLPAVGASDSHHPNTENVIGTPQTVVRAAGLDQDDIVAGLERGTSYVARGQGTALAMTARSGSRSAGIG
ncbi:MAG: CehA/McbA family metallohydrolase, partial [Actinomycetota bacterium]